MADGHYEMPDLDAYPLDCTHMVCRGCGSNNIRGRLVDSSDEAYTDLNYKCMDCGKEGWIDGSDA